MFFPYRIKSRQFWQSQKLQWATELANLIREAQKHYNKAQQSLQTGDWAGYGNELEELQSILNRLTELTAEGRN